MTKPAMILLLGMLTLANGLAACKNTNDPKTAVQAEPKRPASPSGTMSLRGYYTQAGPIGTFEECMAGGRWRVAKEGDNLALEQAYLDSGVGLGARLLVSVEGGIDLRPSPDRGGRETMLIVARFVRAWPGEQCPP
jgi:uncharacterized lipoprotein NlpE involved in copper resistance